MAASADLKKLFQFATSGTNFMFEGKFYDEIDGVAMGSPLGPVLAFYGVLSWTKVVTVICEECKVILYLKYVNDIICLFNSESDADNFFVFLNQQNPKMKFTIEKQILRTNFHF